MPDRVDAAWNDPLALWALIIEDEDTGNTAELGVIAEHLYADAAQARADTARLRAEVHDLAGRLGTQKTAGSVSAAQPSRLAIGGIEPRP